MTSAELLLYQTAKNSILNLFWAAAGVVSEAAEGAASEIMAWGVRNVVGCGIREADYYLEVYLASPMLEGFDAFLAARIPGFEIRFWVTGAFRFHLGLPSDIHMGGHGGKIGLYLASPDETRQFALSCAHVLVGNPSTHPAATDGNGTRIGRLEHRIPLSLAPPSFTVPGHPVFPNHVDCALALLETPAKNLLSGTPIASVAVAAPEGSAVTVVGHAATVRTIRADLKVTDEDTNSYFFDSLTLVQGASGVVTQPGDSGSLVINSSQQPVGIAIAGSSGIPVESGLTPFGPGTAVCDLRKILAALTPVAGPLKIL